MRQAFRSELQLQSSHGNSRLGSSLPIPVSSARLHKEVCQKNRSPKTSPERAHEATEFQMWLLPTSLCTKGHFKKVSLMLLVMSPLLMLVYRHMEDGCSKRFDISTVDFNNRSAYSTNNSKTSSPQLPNTLSKYSLPTLHHYPPISQSMANPYPGNSPGPLSYHSKDPREMGIQHASTWSN